MSKSNVSCIIWCSLGNGPLTTGAGGGGGGLVTFRTDGSCGEEPGRWRKSDVAPGGNIEPVGWFDGLKWNVGWGGGSLTTGRNGELVEVKPSAGRPDG